MYLLSLCLLECFSFRIEFALPSNVTGDIRPLHDIYMLSTAVHSPIYFDIDSTC